MTGTAGPPYHSGMEYSNTHNMTAPPIPESQCRFGVRVKSTATDPFRRLVGEDWQATHWYPTRTERDAALTEIAKRHPYNRIGDRPTIVVEPIDR